MEEEVKSMKDALAEALFLAVTAPSKRQSQRAVELAERIAENLSEHEVAQARREAERRLAVYEQEPPF